MIVLTILGLTGAVVFAVLFIKQRIELVRERDTERVSDWGINDNFGE